MPSFIKEFKQYPSSLVVNCPIISSSEDLSLRAFNRSGQPLPEPVMSVRVLRGASHMWGLGEMGSMGERSQGEHCSEPAWSRLTMY